MKYDHFAHIDFDSTSETPLDAVGGDLRRCFDYWELVRAERPFPTWRDIDLVQLPSSILPLVTVIDLLWSDEGEIDATRMIYRFWGTGHVRAKKIERTGTSIAEHSTRTRVVESEYLRIIEGRRPIAFTKNIRIDDPDHAVSQTTIRLPISNDGQRIDHIMSASEWSDIESFSK